MSEKILLSFSWSHTPRSHLCASPSQTSWPAVSPEPVSPSMGPKQASVTLFLLTAAALFIAQFSSFQHVKVPACSPWISSAGALLASSINSPVGHSELYRPDLFLSFLTSRLLRINCCAGAAGLLLPQVNHITLCCAQQEQLQPGNPGRSCRNLFGGSDSELPQWHRSLYLW